MLARASALALAACSIVLAPADATAQSAPAASVIEVDPAQSVSPYGLEHLKAFLRLLGGETIELDPNDFTPDMRERAPVFELQQAFVQLSKNNGGYTNMGIIDHGPGIITTVVRARGNSARARLSITYEIGGAHRIEGVLVHPDLPTYDSWAQFTQSLDEYGLDASVTIAQILEDGSTESLFSYHEDRSLAVAYHERLFVLDALVKRIDSGAADWLDTITVKDEHKSLPPGETFDATSGSALTLAKLAQRAITQIDHSATDHLIHHLGRDALEKVVRDRTSRVSRNIPFLTTREAFNIRLILTEKYIEDWANADDDGQRAMLPEIDRIQVAEAVYQTWQMPVGVSVVGWFASAEELNDLFVSLYLSGTTDRHATLGGIINELPYAPVDPTVWTSSRVLTSLEPGIVTTSWLLAHRDGRRFALSACFNNPERPIPADQVGALLIAAVETLARAEPRERDEQEMGQGDATTPE